MKRFYKRKAPEPGSTNNLRNSCLDDFNLENLMSHAKLYPHDFDSGELRDLSHHLGVYTSDVKDDDRFSNLQTVAKLSQRTVETRKHNRYPLLY